MSVCEVARVYLCVHVSVFVSCVSLRACVSVRLCVCMRGSLCVV